jgi:hypothetical protein
MIKVKYDGDSPSACMGRLIIKQDGVEIYNKQFCCYSTGSVYHDDEWNWTVEDGELIWDEEDALDFSEDIQSKVRDVLSEVRVCCGGCI